MIDPAQKAITVLGDNVCRTCSKDFGIGYCCNSCGDLWHTQNSIFDRSKFAGLQHETIEALGILEAYELSAGILERLVQKPPYNTMTGKQIHERIIEFKKFIAILVINHGKNTRIEMVSEEIDEIWHTFILFTNEYNKFCKMLVGDYIHHVPNVSTSFNMPLNSVVRNCQEDGVKNFLEDYQKYFGPYPSIWQKNVARVAPRQESNNKIWKRVSIATIAAIATAIALLIFNFWSQNGGIVLWYIAAAFLPIIPSGIVLHRLAKDSYTKKFITIGVMMIFAELLALGVIFVLICAAASQNVGQIVAAFSTIFILSSIMFGYWREKRVKLQHTKNSNGRGGGCGGAACSSGGGGCGGGGC